MPRVGACAAHRHSHSTPRCSASPSARYRSWLFAPLPRTNLSAPLEPLQHTGHFLWRQLASVHVEDIVREMVDRVGVPTVHHVHVEVGPIQEAHFLSTLAAFLHE